MLGGAGMRSLISWAFTADLREEKGKTAIKVLLRIGYIIAREFRQTKISLRASALTYSIVLSMVPLLALSTAVLKGLGSDNQLRSAAVKFIEQLEPADQEQTADRPASADVEPGKESIDSSATGHLHRAVNTIFEYVDRTNFAALGAFGIVTLFLVVLLVLSTIEDALNAIWHTDRGRPIFRKVMDYLALLVLLPVSINVALAGEAMLENDKMMAYLHTVIPASWALKMLFKMLPFFFIVLSLMFLYLFFPHTRVRSSAALIGALFAASFWFLTQKIYFILQVGVANYNAIYGSFATVPLFLVWLHLGWTFILLGASLAHAVQNRNAYPGPQRKPQPTKRLQIAFDILDTVFDRFADRRSTSLDDLCLAQPKERPNDLALVAGQLHQGGFLYLSADSPDEDRYLPATTREQLGASEIVHHLFGTITADSSGGKLAAAALAGAEMAVTGSMDSQPSPPSGQQADPLITT